MIKKFFISITTCVLLGVTVQAGAMQPEQRAEGHAIQLSLSGVVFPLELFTLLVVPSDRKNTLKLVCKQWHALVSFLNWRPLLQVCLEPAYISPLDVERMGIQLIAENNVPLMRRLLEKYPWYAAGCVAWSLRTPLEYAQHYKHDDMVTLLQQYGAAQKLVKKKHSWNTDTLKADRWSGTSLTKKAMRALIVDLQNFLDPFYTAILRGDLQCIKSCYDNEQFKKRLTGYQFKGITQNHTFFYLRDGVFRQAIYLAAACRNYDILTFLLEKYKGPLDDSIIYAAMGIIQGSSTKYTPHPKIVALLLERYNEQEPDDSQERSICQTFLGLSIDTDSEELVKLALDCYYQRYNIPLSDYKLALHKGNKAIIDMITTAAKNTGVFFDDTQPEGSVQIYSSGDVQDESNKDEQNESSDDASPSESSYDADQGEPSDQDESSNEE